MSTPLLLQRLRALHEGLADAGIDHAVGGAIALAVHVLEPRFTSDIDLNVTVDAQRPQHLLAAMPAGVVIGQEAPSVLARERQIRLPWPSPDTPVDLFLPQHPVYHHLVVERAQEVDFLGAGIKVLTATDLMVFKALFNRSKDWVDIESLLEAGAGDVPEAVSWLEEFLGAGEPRATRLRTLAAAS